MKVDAVDAIAETVMTEKFRLMPVGKLAQLQHRVAAQLGAEAAQVRAMPAGPLALDAFAQCDIGVKQVIVLQFRYLVTDFVGLPLHDGNPYQGRGAPLRIGKVDSAEYKKIY